MVTAANWVRRLSPSMTTAVAIGTWLVALPLAVLGVRQANLDPFTTQGVTAPVAHAFLAGVVLVALSLWIRADWFTGVAAGLYAAWCGSTVAAMLVGTPFGYGSMRGDAGRMAALVTHFATTWHPTDAADPDLPAEYPPLYPMVVGRVAALTGRVAWGLLGSAQAVLISAAVLAAFLLWRRLVPGGLALALSAVVFAGLAEPSKGNEILALAVFLPLVLGTFAAPRGARPVHPVVAGVLFGLMVPLYPNFLMFGLLGIGLVLIWGWRGAEHRRAYLLHALTTVLIAAVLASWYLGPLLVAYSQGETQVVADLFKSGALAAQFKLFDSPSVIVYALQVLGMVGIVVLWRRSWWAPPLGLLLAGVLVVKAVMLMRFVATGHSFMLLYVPYLFGFAAAAAGVLTLGDLWRLRGADLLARAHTPERLAGVAAVTAVLAVFASLGWSQWLPAPAGIRDTGSVVSAVGISQATSAHAELLPDGTPPVYPAPVMEPVFPAEQVYRAIDAALGRDHDPVVLSADQRLFSFRAFRNFLPPDRTSSNALTRWDDRKAALDQLSGITDPEAMAQALDRNRFGRIDVLVLRGWKWGNTRDGIVRFHRSAFAGPGFTVHRGLPGGYTVVIRKR